MSYRSPPPGRVEDFTTAFLISFGVVLFIGLFAILAALGFAWSLVAAVAADRLIGALGRA